jgi:surface protein
MANNRIKFNQNGTEDNSIFKGNYAIDVRGYGGGPTSTTGFYVVPDPTNGEYVIYGPGTHARVAADDSDLLDIVGKLGGDNSSVNAAFLWANNNTDVLIEANTFEDIVTDGLILSIDARSIASYPRSGTTWYDLSGSGSDGTLVNGPSFSHVDGGVISFDGSNDRIEFPNVNPNSMTLEFWFKWTNLNDAWLISNQTTFGDNNHGYMFRIDSPSYNCYFRAGTGNSFVQCASTIELDKWYHFAATVSSSETKLYKNGTLVSTASGAAIIDYTGVTGLTVGSDRGAVVRTTGTMSNMRIYDRALDADEVSQNYTALKGRHEFTFTIDTTQPGTSSSNQFTLPLTGGGEYDFEIDWGDGQTDTITVWDQAEKTHTYATEGQYEIKIFGICKGWVFWNGADAKKMLNISNWGGLSIITNTAFAGCSNLTSTASDAPHIGTTSLTSTFYNCTVFNGYVNNWDVSGVTSFDNLFWNTNLFNRDLFNWDVSNATIMRRMFRRARAFNKDIGNWDVSKVSNFQEFLHMASDFNNGGSDSINNWNIKTGGSVNMQEFFKNAQSFNQPIGNWDVSWVTNMLQMFNAATSFNQDITGWDVGYVTNMKQMFGTATVFNQDISSWDTTRVTNMEDMFYNTGAFNQDVSTWDINQVTAFDDFLRLNSTFTTENYDQLLIGWEAQAPVFSGAINFGSVQYSIGGAAEAARDSLINTYGWTISDGGGTYTSEIGGYAFKIDAGDPNSYPGSGTTVTSIGSETFTSTLYGGAAYSSEGGGSFLFDGTDDIAISDISDFDIANMSFSVDCWFKFASEPESGVNDTHGFIGGGGWGGTGDAFKLGGKKYSNGYTEVGISVFGDGAEEQAPNDYDELEWNHYCGTIDISTGKAAIYLNGVQLSLEDSAYMTRDAMPLEWGAVIYSANTSNGIREYYQHGYMGPARIWKNKVLSQEDVAGQYNVEKSRFGL